MIRKTIRSTCAAIGSLLLLLELWPILHWLGEHFETMDPREVAAPG